MERTAVLYDADCGLCRWTVVRLLAWDRHRRLRPVALQDPETDELLGPMDEERKMSSFHVVAPDGRVASGGAAFPVLLELLPAGAPVARLSAAFPGASERAYRFVADNRDKFGRLIGERSRRRDRARLAGLAT